MVTSAAEIRRRILKERGIVLKKGSRKPVSIEELPSSYRKTNLMRLTELRFKDRLENLIFKGTIYEVEKLLGVDASTISKWRRAVSEAFFNQFVPETENLRQLQKNRRGL